MKRDEFRVIIAGSRKFSDYELLKQKCDKILETVNRPIVIVSGTANGADKLGERYANERGYKIKKFPADWDTYGLGAGYRRNQLMAKYSDALIAFWDGISKGTRHMINLAEQEEIKIRIIRY